MKKRGGGEKQSPIALHLELKKDHNSRLYYITLVGIMPTISEAF